MRGSGNFVRENFLSPEVVETKLRDAEVASRLGKWLSEPEHAARVADEASTVLRVVVELLNDEDIQHVIDRTIVKRLAEPQWGPPVGRVLGQLLAENRQEALIQLLCDRAFEWALNAGPTIERVVLRDSPTWSPKFVDQLVGDRIHRELMDFTDKVRRDPNHELRQSATRFLFEFAGDLQNDAVDDRPRRDRQGTADGARRSDPRRRDGLEDPQATGARRRRRSVQRAARPDRRLGGADRGVAARRRRTARQGRQLDHARRAASGRPGTAARPPRSSPTPSSGGTPRRPAAASNCTSAGTSNSSGSTAPWWVRWPAW